MWTSSLAKNDCVITAISNLTGIDYQKIIDARTEVKGAMPSGATLTSKVPEILNELGYRVVISDGLPSTTPCLFRFANGARSKMGHMVACIDGMAIEADGKTWDPTKRTIWQRKCYYIYSQVACSLP